ncbi:MAG TPA: hypothetical protein VGP64_02140 [Polyangia bacterium]|jgi:hypothetical protein
MARQNVALAQRQAPANKRRSRGRKRRTTGEVARAPAPAFDDLAEAFFAAAPPDDAASVALPDSFDDLVAVGPAPRDPRAALRRAFAAVRAAIGRLLAPPAPQRVARK